MHIFINQLRNTQLRIIRGFMEYKLLGEGRRKESLYNDSGQLAKQSFLLNYIAIRIHIVYISAIYNVQGITTI